MRWQRLWVAVFLAAAGIAGVWVLTDTQDGGQVVRVDAPASQPADAGPGVVTVPGQQNLDDMMRKLTEAMASQTWCDAPPVELTEEQKRLAEEVQSTLPTPPTVPGYAAGEVTNIHRRVVPC
jgi:hypothetical protein